MVEGPRGAAYEWGLSNGKEEENDFYCTAYRDIGERVLDGRLGLGGGAYRARLEGKMADVVAVAGDYLLDGQKRDNDDQGQEELLCGIPYRHS